MAKQCGYTQENTAKMVKTVVDAMTDSFSEGSSVQIMGFGTFDVKKRMERIVVNPTSGQRMMVPPKLVLAFRPVNAIKEQLKKGGIAYE